MSPLPTRPYREAATVDPEPPPDFATEVARVGPSISVHAPPPLFTALVGPVLLAALVVAGSVLYGLPMVAAVPVGLATLAFLAWPPLRVRGTSVALHAEGMVLSRGGVRRVVPFEDVNEVWFEFDWLDRRSGTPLRAIRLLDFSGQSHRVPLALNDAATLATSVLQGCSTPLLQEARRALALGETLTFGDVRLDRDGITVREARLPWRETRLAVVARARVFFYRRFPILAWRTVRLGRIPNPTVFIGLVMANVSNVRVDDNFVVPLAFGAEASPARLTKAAVQATRNLALRYLLIGGVSFLTAGVLTWRTWGVHGSSDNLATGPVVFGGICLYQALVTYLAGRRR